MQDRRLLLIAPVVVIIAVLLSGCRTIAPAAPSIDFCRHNFGSGTPTATILLDPGEAPIAEVSVSFDRSDLDSTPSTLVKEASLSELNGQVWRRGDPATPDEWWIYVPQEDWQGNPLESLVAVSMEWPFSPPLADDEKLVYKLHVKYLTPEGNTLLVNSDAHSISSDPDDNLSPLSDNCLDYIAFSIGG